MTEQNLSGPPVLLWTRQREKDIFLDTDIFLEEDIFLDTDAHQISEKNSTWTFEPWKLNHYVVSKLRERKTDGAASCPKGDKPIYYLFIKKTKLGSWNFKIDTQETSII